MRVEVILGLCSGILLAATALCRAEPLIIGSDFSNRIPANGTGNAPMNPAGLTVSQHVHIIDLDVYLDITHQNVIDLIITLVTPSGQYIQLKDETLMNLYFREEEPWSNMYGTIFDDEADLYMADVPAPYTNRFRPDAGVLSVLDSQDAYGHWTLEIDDIAYGDIGTLDRWELQFEVIDTPEPSSLTCLTLFAIYGITRKRRKIITPA